MTPSKNACSNTKPVSGEILSRILDRIPAEKAQPCKTYDIIALGECLVDVLCTEQGEMLQMEGNPGGAPANALAMAAKLGRKTALISKVGADMFGAFLKKKIGEAGIDTHYVQESKVYPTTLAMVSLDATGNRDFRFYRTQTADIMLDKSELPLSALADTHIFHVGSLSMTAEPARSATIAAVRLAKQAGAKISFDPNWRPPLWNNEEEARDAMLTLMEQADYVKVSEEELAFLTGSSDLEEGVADLQSMTHATLLAVTLGEKGCRVYAGDQKASANAYAIDCVDTTGAGDAFWGAALSWLLAQGSPQDLQGLAEFSCAAGSLTSTQKGAITAQPTLQEIQECIQKGETR